ncbi:MAG: CDP-diacylglycerol--glycerol-3-phosphate 3-phosphatidyltransferase, partial [Clostridia bacterium]
MNLPNKLSVLRIVLVPIMAIVYVLPLPYVEIWAIAIFAIAAFTDFLDGYIARKYNMVTNLGKLLDPIADKLLITFALFIIVEQNILPIGIGCFCGALIIGRELLISMIRQIAASKGTIIQANKYGKIKTIFQDISLPMLMLLGMQGLKGTFWNIFSYISYGMFAIAVLLTIISCLVYMVQN